VMDRAALFTAWVCQVLMVLVQNSQEISITP
jgi:hypothetical protein